MSSPWAAISSLGDLHFFLINVLFGLGSLHEPMDTMHATPTSVWVGSPTVLSLTNSGPTENSSFQTLCCGSQLGAPL